MPSRNTRTRFACALALLAVLLTLASATVRAHHSLSHFETREIVAKQAVVTGFRYVNPHVLIEGLVPDEGGYRNWIFEAESSLVLKDQGWNSASLRPGDWITVYGNPLKSGDRDHLFMDFVRLEGGRWLISTPRTFDRYMDENPDLMQPPPAAEPSMAISGTWQRRAPRRVSLDELPLNAAGRALAERFDPILDPIQYCVPVGFPRLLLDPWGLRITETDAGDLRFDKELAGTRIASATAPAADLPPAPHGHARLGREGANYVIESTGFAELAWGTLPGLDSSTDKRVREVYRVADDGLGLHLELTIEDPRYLEEPVQLEIEYRRVPDYPFADLPCASQVGVG